MSKEILIINEILRNIIVDNELCTTFCQKVFDNFINCESNIIRFKYDYSIILSDITNLKILFFTSRNKFITSDIFYDTINITFDYNDLLIQKLIFEYII